MTVYDVDKLIQIGKKADSFQLTQSPNSQDYYGPTNQRLVDMTTEFLAVIKDLDNDEMTYL